MYDLDQIVADAEHETSNNLLKLTVTANELLQCADPASIATGERLAGDLRRVRKLIANGKPAAARKIVFSHLLAQQIGWIAA